jgi:hypothetical protein
MPFPFRPRSRFTFFCVGGLVVAATVAASVFWALTREDPGDPRLRQFVHARPPVPIVFTSRTEPASFVGPAPEGEVYTYPGQRLWQAREGRLRLLSPRGNVVELTWGKTLPDGGTLIDVMSPTISLDGKTILFAGRKGGDDPGHFRLYAVGVNGKDLRQVTGGEDDPGCSAAPPLRYGANGARLSREERCRIDYDDVDPSYLADGSISFISSRTPDLGRGHARRATNIWAMGADGSNKRPMSGNRNNDRWPFLLRSNFLAFSLWSRNTEVISADYTEIVPYRPGEPSATLPTNYWFGAVIGPGFFGSLVKTTIPVWRPRPLFNGNLAFMTDLGYDRRGPEGTTPAILQAVQAEMCLTDYAASAMPKKAKLPRPDQSHLFRGPSHDEQGRPLSVATPSPCPGHHIVLSAAPVEPGQAGPQPGRYGLYLASDDWPRGSDAPVPAAAVNLQLLFDDPDFVDAEPVAVYPRNFESDFSSPPPQNVYQGRPGLVPFPGAAPEPPIDPSASAYSTGYVYNYNLGTSVNEDVPGQKTDRGEGPIFAAPPTDNIKEIRFYGSHRDSFEDARRERIAGDWELLVRYPLGERRGVEAHVPARIPIVLAIFTNDGRVLRWTTKPKDSEGRQATFYGFAGDHYSSFRPNGVQFCSGCHPGHSGPGKLAGHAEKLK